MRCLLFDLDSLTALSVGERRAALDLAALRLDDLLNRSGLILRLCEPAEVVCNEVPEA